MSIRELLKKWRLPLPRLENISSMQVSLEYARKEVEISLSNVQPKQPSKFDLNYLYSVIQNHFNSERNLEGLSFISLRKAPWVIFTHPETMPGKLGKNQRFSELYLNWIDEWQKVRTASTLLFIFLREYPTDFQTFNLWRKRIWALLEQLDNPRIHLLRERCKHYHLLSPDGTSKFNDILSNIKNDSNEILNKAGLIGQLENRGFLLAAYKELLIRVKNALSEGDSQNEFLQKFFSISITNKDGIKSLRFKTESADMANSLLLPYADNKAHPKHAQAIQKFLIQYMGDPRVTLTGGWMGVETRAKEVMFGWLVEATLDVYFKILDATADPIWTYRRAFWSAYYKKKFVTDAWAVLGKDAVLKVESVNDKNIHFGRLNGSYSRNQSVLLMKIGNFIVAEWSHNGKCRLWQSNEENEEIIPKLHNISYSAYSLRNNADFEQVHHASVSGTWQRKIEYFIRRHTNIRISYSEYMP